MGTPALTGSFTGTLRVLIRASSTPDLAGLTMASTMCNIPCTFDFDAGEVTVNGGNQGSLFPTALAPSTFTNCVPYLITAPGGGGGPILPLVDNLDGTYTVGYNFNVGGGTAVADTTIRLEISHVRSCAAPPGPGPFQNIVFTTVEDFWRGVPGRPLASPFFNNATPSWEGCASPDPV